MNYKVKLGTLEVRAGIPMVSMGMHNGYYRQCSDCLQCTLLNSRLREDALIEADRIDGPCRNCEGLDPEYDY